MGEREALGRPKPSDIKLVLNAVWHDKNRLAKARKCIASLTKLMNNEREMFNTVGVNVRPAPRHMIAAHPSCRPRCVRPFGARVVRIRQPPPVPRQFDDDERMFVIETFRHHDGDFETATDLMKKARICIYARLARALSAHLVTAACVCAC